MYGPTTVVNERTTRFTRSATRMVLSRTDGFRSIGVWDCADCKVDGLHGVEERWTRPDGVIVVRCMCCGDALREE